MKRALVFVSRCQNLESEHNTLAFAKKNPDDGGFIYTAAAGGQSPAGQTPNGGLRSYGSMTYAGLKSMIYAGVRADDPRVKAARKWIQQHYDLSSNPGMGQAGLYYYYQTVAKALERHRRGRPGQRRRPAARLAARLDGRTGQAAAGRRLLDQHGGPLDGKRPQPGHRLRPVDAIVLQAGEVMFFRNLPTGGNL